MRDDDFKPTTTDEALDGMTVKQLRQVARDEGICLGYDGHDRKSIIGAIRAFRHHMRMEAQR